MITKTRLSALASLVLGISTFSLFGAPAAAPKPDTKPTVDAVGLHAKVGEITAKGFASMKYQYGGGVNRTWKSAPIRVDGATTQNLATGELWHGLVRDSGVCQDPKSGIRYRVYSVIEEWPATR